MSSVIRSSRSTLEVTSSPDATRKRRIDGSDLDRYSSMNFSSSASTICLQSAMSVLSVPLTSVSASSHLRWRGTSFETPGMRQYGSSVMDRYSASRSSVYTASMTASSLDSASNS